MRLTSAVLAVLLAVTPVTQVLAQGRQATRSTQSMVTAVPSTYSLLKPKLTLRVPAFDERTALLLRAGTIDSLATTESIWEAAPAPAPVRRVSTGGWVAIGVVIAAVVSLIVACIALCGVPPD